MDRVGGLSYTGIGYAPGVFAGLWVVLAFLRPEVTFHLGPVIAAASFPVSYRIRSGPIGPRAAIALFVGAVFLVVVATTVLTIADRLRGPSLLPSGGAALEAYVFGGAAAAAGAAVAYLWRDR